MRKLFLVLSLVIIITNLASCEKDDICVDSNTPLMTIEFFNIADTAELKNVPKLRVGGIGNEYTVSTFTDRSDVNTIQVPLKTNETSTSFAFIQNSTTDETTMNETGNQDIITFSYTIEEVFESRACGFVVQYADLSASLTPDADEWIQNIIIADTLINNKTTTHVKIYL